MTQNYACQSCSDRLLIIHADDFGSSHSANQAIIELFRSGGITSASIMMPCEAAAEAAAFCKRNDTAHVGIHLTLTSSRNQFLKPVFKEFSLDSLITRDGFFPEEVSLIERDADSQQVKKELAAQIESAIALGIDPTHLDCHEGCLLGLALGRDFLDIVFELCEEYALPFLLPHRIVLQSFLNEAQKSLFRKKISEAAARGIYLIDDLSVFPYELEEGESYETLKIEWGNRLAHLMPGITQMVTHPAMMTTELLALTGHAAKRELEYRLLRDSGSKALVEEMKIKLISWKHLRDLQRRMGC
ncbi:polysaccharide deacetylase family protein [Paenibacillus sp. sptzw28]|uniref:polysaccharide deacetylase family protein n=1 Tax=Paenibacillus sp. sptzw28 TaxID=715179 RepID=UPI001C6EB6C4|nr:polysaccharide deacetylase family protein [Paenibacillus sp. sptzw28]QYR20725.1 polysaccharide deacetylase family protein [Paenibacillus sp. sptzw28]